MKKIGEIKDVGYTWDLFGYLAFNNYFGNAKWCNLYYINKIRKQIQLYDRDINSISCGDNYALIQRDESECYLVNEKFEVLQEFNTNIYVGQKLKNYLQFELENEEGNWDTYRIDKFGKIHQVKQLYSLELKNIYVPRIWEKDVYAYSKETEELLWQKDLSLPEYGVFKDIDGKVYPNKINSPAMADTDTIYLSMAGGQLIALNAEDGSTKWILEGEKKGKCVLYKNLIYKNTGNHLIVIDTDKSQEIKRVSYKDYKDNSSGMTGEFNVYEDVIVMKNQIDENVVVIDRHTLKMIDFVHLKYGIKNSSANCTVWYNNQLYAIDTSDVMHIYELE